MILNAVLCDYLRLTTFEEQDYIKLRRLWRNHAAAVGMKTEDATLMQYGGKKTGHGFIGTGRQKQGYHYLVQFSGSPAHLAYDEIVGAPLVDTRCTRIDVQMTIPLPVGYLSEDLFGRLNGNLPYGRIVTLWKSGDGMDTVYLGKLTTKNGRVTRIYVKEYVGGRALRFETQWNGGHANQHWKYLREGGVLNEILVLELESLEELNFEPLATFYALVGGFVPAPRPIAVETSMPTLDWLLNTCDPVIRRMLADHDHGWKVHNWLTGLLDWSQRIG